MPPVHHVPMAFPRRLPARRIPSVSPLDPQKQSELRAKLAALQEQARPGAPAAEQARVFNQIGELYAQLEEQKESLKAYGKAIDAYIETGKVPVATALCSKVVRRFPNVTRTHFTMSCLALHQGLRNEAVHSLTAYADNAVLGNTQALAIPRLRFLAAGVSDPAVRRAIAEQMAKLGDLEGSQKVREKTLPTSPGLINADLAKVLLDAARWDSDALWASYWLR